MKTKATLVMLAFLLLHTPNTGAAPGIVDYCTEDDDEHGVGGTDVSCKFRCAMYNQIAVGVKSSDIDAWVTADAECGGADAGCGPELVTCTGYSPDRTNRTDTGDCKGTSDEFNDSLLRVWCFALGLDSDADPRDAICPHVPEFPDCEDDPQTPSDPTNPTVPVLPDPNEPPMPDPAQPLPGKEDLQRLEDEACRALAENTTVGCSLPQLPALCGPVAWLGEDLPWIELLLPMVEHGIIYQMTPSAGEGSEGESSGGERDIQGIALDREDGELRCQSFTG